MKTPHEMVQTPTCKYTPSLDPTRTTSSSTPVTSFFQTLSTDLNTQKKHGLPSSSHTSEKTEWEHGLEGPLHYTALLLNLWKHTHPSQKSPVESSILKSPVELSAQELPVELSAQKSSVELSAQKLPVDKKAVLFEKERFSKDMDLLWKTPSRDLVWLWTYNTPPLSYLVLSCLKSLLKDYALTHSTLHSLWTQPLQPPPLTQDYPPLPLRRSSSPYPLSTLEPLTLTSHLYQTYPLPLFHTHNTHSHTHSHTPHPYPLLGWINPTQKKKRFPSLQKKENPLGTPLQKEVFPLGRLSKTAAWEIRSLDPRFTHPSLFPRKPTGPLCQHPEMQHQMRVLASLLTPTSPPSSHLQEHTDIQKETSIPFFYECTPPSWVKTLPPSLFPSAFQNTPRVAYTLSELHQDELHILPPPLPTSSLSSPSETSSTQMTSVDMNTLPSQTSLFTNAYRSLFPETFSLTGTSPSKHTSLSVYGPASLQTQKVTLGWDGESHLRVRNDTPPSSSEVSLTDKIPGGKGMSMGMDLEKDVLSLKRFFQSYIHDVYFSSEEMWLGQKGLWKGPLGWPLLLQTASQRIQAWGTPWALSPYFYMGENIPGKGKGLFKEKRFHTFPYPTWTEHLPGYPSFPGHAVWADYQVGLLTGTGRYVTSPEMVEGAATSWKRSVWTRMSPLRLKKGTHVLPHETPLRPFPFLDHLPKEMKEGAEMRGLEMWQSLANTETSDGVRTQLLKEETHGTSPFSTYQPACVRFLYTWSSHHHVFQTQAHTLLHSLTDTLTLPEEGSVQWFQTQSLEHRRSLLHCFKQGYTLWIQAERMRVWYHTLLKVRPYLCIRLFKAFFPSLCPTLDVSSFLKEQTSVFKTLFDVRTPLPPPPHTWLTQPQTPLSEETFMQNVFWALYPSLYTFVQTYLKTLSTHSFKPQNPSSGEQRPLREITEGVECSVWMSLLKASYLHLFPQSFHRDQTLMPSSLPFTETPSLSSMKGVTQAEAWAWLSTVISFKEAYAWWGSLLFIMSSPSHTSQTPLSLRKRNLLTEEPYSGSEDREVTQEGVGMKDLPRALDYLKTLTLESSSCKGGLPEDTEVRFTEAFPSLLQTFQTLQRGSGPSQKETLWKESVPLTEEEVVGGEGMYRTDLRGYMKTFVTSSFLWSFETPDEGPLPWLTWLHPKGYSSFESFYYSGWETLRREGLHRRLLPAQPSKNQSFYTLLSKAGLTSMRSHYWTWRKLFARLTSYTRYQEARLEGYTYEQALKRSTVKTQELPSTSILSKWAYSQTVHHLMKKSQKAGITLSVVPHPPTSAYELKKASPYCPFPNQSLSFKPYAPYESQDYKRWGLLSLKDTVIAPTRTQRARTHPLLYTYGTPSYLTYPSTQRTQMRWSEATLKRILPSSKREEYSGSKGVL